LSAQTTLAHIMEAKAAAIAFLIIYFSIVEFGRLR
jgi:hypothetical protein